MDNPFDVGFGSETEDVKNSNPFDQGMPSNNAFSSGANAFQSSQNQLLGADGQKPPTVDDEGVSSPLPSAVTPPADPLQALAGDPFSMSPADRAASSDAEIQQAWAAGQQSLDRGQVDPAGYPIDVNRPLIVTDDGNIATERTATVPGTALGMPMPGVFFNIPTIIQGVPMSPEAAAQLTQKLIQNGTIKLEDIPRFGSEQEAVSAAVQRSNTIAELRKSEIEDLSASAQDQALRDRIDRILAQPGPTQEKAALFDIKNPSVTNVFQLDDGSWFQVNSQTDMGPVSEAQAAYAIQKANNYQASNNFASRGFGRMLQNWNTLLLDTGLRKPEDFIKRFSELERIFPKAPKEIQDGLREISEAKGVWDSIKAIGNNPIAALSVAGESLVMSAPQIATLVVGTLMGQPVPAVGAAGVMSFGTEYTSVLNEEIISSGVDPQDEKALMELVNDPEFWSRARERGTIRGIPIAIFDTLSMGLSGKFIAAGISKGGSAANITGRTFAETGQQMLFGAGGELTAQQGEKTFGFRDTFSPGEIILEGVAEGPIGAIEIATSLPGNIRAAQDKAIENELNTLEQAATEQAASTVARDLLNPNSPAYGFVDPETTIKPAETTETTNPFDQPPAEQPVAEKPVAEQPPVETPPVQETPVETPVQETPVQETPVQETPVEAPAERPKGGFGSDPAITSAIQNAVTRRNNEAESISRGQDPATANPPAANPNEYDPEVDSYIRGDYTNRPPEGTSVSAIAAWVASGNDPASLTNSEISLIMRSSSMPGVDQSALEAVSRESVIRQYIKANVNSQSAEFKPSAPAQSAAPEVNPQAPDPGQEIVAVNVSPTGSPIAKQKSTPDGKTKVNVVPVVVDISDLKAASGILQPRDRSLKESDVEAQRRAANLMPEMLMDSPTTDTGAPIIARDGTILSGNGRVLSLRAVYDNFPEKAAEYRQAVANYGRADGANFPNPVLVFKLEDDMTIEQLVDFADRSNRSSIASMSSTERAQRDARAMTQNIINSYVGGDLTSSENRAFVDQFIASVVAPNEQNAMSRDGQLTKEGVLRMQNAILASAYNDTDALAIMLDSTDDNIKAISNAMMANAPKLSQLKADIAAGDVRPEFDVSQQIADAAKLISSLRDRGIKPRDYFAQQDAFSDADPMVEALVRSLYNDDLTRAKSQKFMKDVLDFYVEEAGNRKSDGLFEDPTTPVDVIQASRRRAERKADGTDEGQGSLLPEGGDGNSVAPSSQQAQSTSSQGSGQDTGAVNPANTQEAGQVTGGLNYDPTNRASVAAELQRRISALGLEGVNSKIETSSLGESVRVSLKIGEDLANRYPDDLKTVNGKTKPALQISAPIQKVFGETYTPTMIVQKGDVPAVFKVKNILFDPEIDSRGTAIENEIRNLAEEIRGTIDDNAGSQDTLEASVAPDAQLRRGQTTSDAATVILREDAAEGSTRGTKSGRVLLAQKETLRQSVFLQAFRDAGEDPNLAVNYTPEKQFRILSKLMTDKFGFKYIAKPKTNPYDGVQALLDAYRNLQWMTHALGLPYNAIGLDNSLGLALPGRAWGGYLAAYINKQGGPAAPTQSDVGAVPAPVVIMPKRSNSFAHEWGHALDYHILDKFGEEWGRGITGRIRSNMESNERPWQDGAPQSVADAMGNLINAMFFDKAELAAKIMEVEQQIAKTQAYEAKTGKTTKKLVQLEEQLRRLKEGSTRSKVGRTQYRKDAEDFAVATNSDPDYWTRPTEMFARAFEAYVARNVENRGGTTEFITMESEAYEMTLEQVEGSDIRLAMTYPNEADRNNIFLAMDRLMEALRTEAFESGPSAAPGDYDLIDARLDFAAQIDPNNQPEDARGWVENEKRAWRAAQTQAKRERPTRFPDANGWRKSAINVEDMVLNRIFYAKRGILFTLARRYKGNVRANNIIEDIISRVATDPGGTKMRVTVEGGTFEEATRRESRRFAIRFKQILDRYDIDQLSEAQLQQLRLILTADPDAQADAASGADPLITAAAGEIRTKILQPMYDYMRRSGYDIGYLADGSYMPRMLDSVLALSDKQKFLGNGEGKRGAIGLYADVIYENDLGSLDTTNEEQLTELLRKARKSQGYMNDEQLELLAEAQALIRQRNKLDPDENEAEISQINDELALLHEQLYEEVRMPFAEAAANDWYTRIGQQVATDPGAHSVQGSFTKKRKLPKEADTYMVDFYLDPIESLNQYIPAVTRKIEYERRFGQSLVPPGSKLRDKNNPGSRRDYLDYLLEVRGVEAGIDTQDLQQLRQIVRKITGTDNVSADYMGKKALDYIHVFGTMALLPRAVLSSIAEPLTAGVTTGSARKGLKTFVQVFDEALAIVSTDAKRRTLFYRQLANVLGVIDDPSVGEVVANRLGGTLQEDPKLNARLGRFFVRTKLQGLTNAQRRSTMRTGLQYFAEIAAEYQDSNTSAQGKQQIREIFRDFGVNDTNLDQFTAWMAEQRNGDYKLPSIDEMLEKNGEMTDMGQILSVAIGRFIDQTIQDPKSVDRPLYAEHPLGRMVYGIQSFMAAFSRNVLLGSFNKLRREKQQRGYGSMGLMLGTQMLPAFATLYGGHLLVSTVREMLLNPDKLREEREKDNLEEYLLLLAFQRAGLLGRFDPIWNSLYSTRYQSDLSNMVVGASASYYLKALQRMAGVLPYFGNNSENTVAAEYQAAIGFWDLAVNTAIVMAASAPGLGPYGGTAAGLAAGFATSPRSKHYVVREFIEATTGEEYYPGRGGRKKKEAKVF